MKIIQTILIVLSLTVFSSCSNKSKVKSTSFNDKDSTQTEPIKPSENIAYDKSNHPAKGLWLLNKIYVGWPEQDSIINPNESWNFSAKPYIQIFKNDSLVHKYLAELEMEIPVESNDTIWKMIIIDEKEFSMGFMTATEKNDTLRLFENSNPSRLYEFVK